MSKRKNLAARPISVKHVYLDIVGFSKDRTAESQTAIHDVLKRIVRESIEAHGISPRRLLLSPAGDGVCIVLLNVDSPYDIHVRIALTILKKLNEYNSAVHDPAVRFEIRIGVNAGLDDLVTDINGFRTIIGAGINEAQRIMSVADAGQVLVGDAVFAILKHRRQYASAFRSYAATVKHGLVLQVHQLVASQHPFLNVTVPEEFQSGANIRAQGDASDSGHSLRARGAIIKVEIGPSECAETTRSLTCKRLRIGAMIDTGASVTVINPQVAATCGLRQVGVVAISTTGRITEVPEFVGAIHFPGLKLKSVDPMRFVACQLPGEPYVACLVGRDVLNRWRVTYDGSSGEVEIEESSRH